MRLRWAAAAVLLHLLPAVAIGAGDLRPERLRCEYHPAPLAVDTTRPRLSWIVTSNRRGARQTAYRVLAARSRAALLSGKADLWDTGRVASDESLHIEYRGKPLTSTMECWWQVMVWDGQGRASAWSAPARWSMGLLKRSDWKAKWIGCEVDRSMADDPTYLPAPLLRREFRVAGKVRRAVVYATAAGLYELYLNGQRVGQDFFTPGWTEYHKRLYYQAYDVTGLLRNGRPNAIGAILGDGWYGLHHSGRGRLALKAQLMIEYASGRREIIATDASWKTTDRSPVRTSDIYNGETYDARLAPTGWTRAGYDDRAWKPVVLDFAGQTAAVWKDVTDTVAARVRDNRLTIRASNDLFGDPRYGVVKALRVRYRQGLRMAEKRVNEGQTLTLGNGRDPLAILKAEYGADTTPSEVRQAVLQAHPGAPVRRTDELRPRTIAEPKPGVYVYDLGQNMVGWVRLRVQGAAGTTVTLRFAEMLNPDGSIYTANLRGAKCTDRYTLRGGGVEIWEPKFTFHGFRYVEVTGYPGRPGKDAVRGIVLGSDCGITGAWTSSNPLLNQLYHNIVWGQKGNYLEVPTDCPQRDERMGWSGDAEVFVGTGAYCMDTASFFTAWMRTFNDSQRADGAYPDVSPKFGGVSPAWGDAGVICPWTLYEQYGDVRMLRDHYDGMKRWVEYLRQHSKDGIRPAEGYGDWLNVQDNTPKEVISTAFYARSADLLSRAATVLGKKVDAIRYQQLRDQIARAFTRDFVTKAGGPDKPGSIRGGSQTAYLLALEFDLLPNELRGAAFARLIENLDAHGNHLTVGFVGVDHLLPVLSRFGRSDLAWRLLTNTTYPSWLYSVTQGATTIWERWDGWRHDKGFQDPGMNSFNHYAFGACGKWMFSDAAGIAAEEPSFRRIRIRPTAGSDLTYVQGRYDSIRGPIVSRWRRQADRLEIAVTIPANTRALVYVPASGPGVVREGAGPAVRAQEVRYVGMARGYAVFDVGSGSYRFSAPAVGISASKAWTD